MSLDQVKAITAEVSVDEDWGIEKAHGLLVKSQQKEKGSSFSFPFRFFSLLVLLISVSFPFLSFPFLAFPFAFFLPFPFSCFAFVQLFVAAAWQPPVPRVSQGSWGSKMKNREKRGKKRHSF